MKVIRMSAVRAPESKRPMTQSERAMMQPRDEIGRFAKEDERQNSKGGVLLFRGRTPTESEISSRGLTESRADLIVVDESNSFSGKGDGRRQNLTVVCTRVRDRKSYGRIAEQIPQKKGVRTKYSNTEEPDLSKIIGAISKQNIEIVEAHQKIDYAKLTDAESKRRFYMEVLKQAVGKAVEPHPEREADILLDSPPIRMNYDLEVFGRQLVDSGYRIRWFETKRSASDRYLTVHDFETGAVSDHVEAIPDKGHLFQRFLERRMR